MDAETRTAVEAEVSTAMMQIEKHLGDTDPYVADGEPEHPLVLAMHALLRARAALATPPAATPEEQKKT